MHTFLNEHIYIPHTHTQKRVVQWTGMFVCKLVSKVIALQVWGPEGNPRIHLHVRHGGSCAHDSGAGTVKTASLALLASQANKRQRWHMEFLRMLLQESVCAYVRFKQHVLFVPSEDVSH